MKLLIIGSGGREHALTWKLAQSPEVTDIFVAPGNAGTALEPKTKNIAIDPLDIPALISFAQEENIALTVVGPEAPLAAGIVDQFQAVGLACFGPSQAAAQLEASKEFAKDFMQANGIPTARYATFNDPDKAKAYVAGQSLPIVIKADGLAAGKGVIIAQSQQEAFETIDNMLLDQSFGQAGARVVIEEFLTGEEASFIVIADGEHCLPFATSQDHKARDEGDTGPNTGGMGAYSPAPVVTPELHEKIMQQVIEPTLAGLKRAGTPFTGFLYAGLMISPNGELKVLEYNCRLGDPEAQVLLFRLKNDLLPILRSATMHQLDQQTAVWHPGFALTTVLASKGYPGTYSKGLSINGLPTTSKPAQKVFHAGTKQQNEQTVTNGGRVLCATARGETLKQAQQQSHKLLQPIKWEGAFYRSDIGHKALSYKKELAEV